ncbi:MAG: PKD domain-containing protein, partial [Candidatus Methanomethylicaceae archaeon]
MRGIKNLAYFFLSAVFVLLAISASAVYGQGGQPPSLTLFNPEIQGLTVTINGVTMPGTPGAIITRIYWDWGDGIREDQWFAASHTYSYPGTYTITVTSFQSDGLFTTRSVTVTLTAGQLIPTALSISLEPNVAEANRETRVIIRGVLTRRDTGQGLSSKMVLVTPRFSYARPQTANVVTDGRGSFQADFIVNAPAGTYYFTAVFGGDSQFDYSDARAALTVQQPQGQPPSLTLFEPEIRGLTVTINGVTMPGTPGATITRIQWDWGDGYREDHWFAASHTYSRPGTYTITVTAFQSDGLSITKTITVTLVGGRKVRVHVYAIDDANRTRGYLIDRVDKIAGAQIRVDYPGGSQVLTTTSTFPGPYVEVDENSTVTVSLVGEPVGWRFAGYWDIYTISWTQGSSRTFNVGTSDKHVVASFTPARVKSLDRMTISGPSEVQGTSGNTANYTCTAYFNDGTSEDVTNSAAWSETFASATISRGILTITSDLSSDQRGEVNCSYTYNTVTKSASLSVIIRAVAKGNLAYFDLDYQGTAPNPDGSEQRSVTVQAGASLTLFFRYNEGNANNQYIVRVYPEWDKNRYIANSDNDETISEVGQEIGGYRWDREAFSAPTAPGTYKVRVVYNASATPPTWDRYDRLLAEGTVVVEQRAETRIGTELSISLEPNTAPENKETAVLVKGVLLRRDNRQGIANKPVVLSFRGQQRTVTTDSRGSFQAEFAVNLPAGSYPFTASFAGDSQFESANATATLTVLRLEVLIQTKLTLEIDRASIQADTLETVRFRGKLIRTDTGQGLAGKTVYITIPGESVPVPVTTDATGVYGLVYGVKLPAGTYKVEARYQGETIDNARYEASSATATLTVLGSVVKFDFLDVFTRPSSIWGAFRYDGPEDVKLVMYLTINSRTIVNGGEVKKRNWNNVPSSNIYYIDFLWDLLWPKLAQIEERQSYAIQAKISIVDMQGNTLASSQREESWGKATIEDILRQAQQELKRYDNQVPSNIPYVDFPSMWAKESPYAAYNGLTDTIRVWHLNVDNEGAIVHEYGHFLEDKWYLINLGGDCPSHHAGCEESNIGCAMKEGWADFIADVLTQDKPYLQFGLENYRCVTKGEKAEIVELAIAGILWDLYDDGENESFDHISLPLSEIIPLVKESMKWDSKGLRTLYDNFKAKYNSDLVRLFDKLLKEGYGIDYSGSAKSAFGPPEGKTIEEAIASLVPGDPPDVANPDVYIGDQEILRAQQLWISGSPVPGTDGKVIDDAM